MAAPSVSGTPVEIDDATAANSTSVTVPSGATGVFVGVGGYHAVANFFSAGSVTLGGSPLTAYGSGGDASTTAHMGALWFLEGTLAPGAQTLAWDWSGVAAPDDGALIVCGFVTGSASAAAIRDSDGIQNTDWSTSRATKTLTAVTNDLIVAFGEWFPNGSVAPPAATWAGATEQAQYDRTATGYRSTVAAYATALPSGSQTVAARLVSYATDGSLNAIVIQPAASAGAGPPPVRFNPIPFMGR